MRNLDPVNIECNRRSSFNLSLQKASATKLVITAGGDMHFFFQFPVHAVHAVVVFLIAKLRVARSLENGEKAFDASGWKSRLAPPPPPPPPAIRATLRAT